MPVSAPSIVVTGANNAATALNVAVGKSTFQSITSPLIYQTNYPFKVNDISSQFNGVKTVFPMKFNQSSITSTFSALQTEDIDVMINGVQLEPYAKDTMWPWVSPYDWFNGYKVSGSNVVIYNAPAQGDKAVVSVARSTSITRTHRYPFSATTVALGE